MSHLIASASPSVSWLLLFNSRVLEEALVLNEGEIIALLNGLLQNWRIHLNSLKTREREKKKEDKCSFACSNWTSGSVWVTTVCRQTPYKYEFSVLHWFHSFKGAVFIPLPSVFSYVTQLRLAKRSDISLLLLQQILCLKDWLLFSSRIINVSLVMCFNENQLAFFDYLK